MTTPTVAEVRAMMKPNVRQYRTFTAELSVNRAAVAAVERDADDERDSRRATVTPEQRARRARRDALARLRALRA